MPIGSPHDLKDLPNVVIGNVFVEKIGHRVDKNTARLFPGQRYLKTVGPQLEVEALFIGMIRNPAKSLREDLGVAVVAPPTVRQTCATASRRVQSFPAAPNG